MIALPPTKKMAAADAVHPAEDGGKSHLTQFVHSVLRLKRPTADDLLFTYAPAFGAVSYSAFSVHIFRPELLESLFPRNKYVVANCLLFNAHLGAGLFLYNSRHLTAMTRYHRILYSVYGTLLFNFGSILLWAVTKSILPDDGLVRTVFSLSSSICMLLVGREYVSHVDNWRNNGNN